MKKTTMLLATLGLVSSAAYAKLSMDTEFRYKYVETETKEGTSAVVKAADPSFVVDDWELAMSGDLKDGWTYYGEFEMKDGGELTDAYLQKKLWIDGLSLRLGKFDTPELVIQDDDAVITHVVDLYTDSDLLGAGLFYTYGDHSFALTHQLNADTTKHQGGIYVNYTGIFEDMVKVGLNFSKDRAVTDGTYYWATTMGIGAKFWTDMFCVGAEYGKKETENKPLADTDAMWWNVYVMGILMDGAIKPWVQYGANEVEMAADASTKDTAEKTSWELGVYYQPVKDSAKWYIAYTQAEEETTRAPAAAATHPLKVDTTTLALGIKYDFDLM